MKRFLNIFATLFLSISLIAVINVFVNVFEAKNNGYEAEFPIDPKVKAASVTYEIADSPQSAYSAEAKTTTINNSIYSDSNVLKDFLVWKDSEPGLVKKAEVIPDTYFDEDAQFEKRLNVAGNGLIEGGLAIGGRLRVDDEATFEDKVTIDNDEVEINGVRYYFPEEQAADDGYVLANDGEGNLDWISQEEIFPGISGTDNRLARFNDAGTGIEDSSIDDLYSGGVALTIDSDGGIGIGTTVTLYDFEVNGTSNFTSFFLNSVLITATASEINSLSGFSADAGAVTFGDGSGITNDQANFYWDDSSDSLGIGTSAPTQALDVDGGIRTTDDVYIGSIGLNDTTGTATSGASRIGVFDEFQNTNSTNLQDVLDDLDASITTFAAGAGDIEAVGSMAAGETFNSASADDQWLGLGASAGRIEFDDQTTDEVNILNARLGIGTTVPTETLHVAGTALVTGEITASSGVNIGLNQDANLISTSSVGASSTTLFIGNESILTSGDIGVSVQAWDTDLDTMAGLSSADGNFIVGSGSGWVVESGNTARTSLGLGTGDSPQFAGLNITGNTTLGDAAGDTVTSNAASWTFANDTNVTVSGGVGGFSFDTNTLSIDSTNDRVGVGTTAPSYAFEVNGSAGGIAITRTNDTASIEPFLLFRKGTTPVDIAQIRAIDGGGLRFTNGNASTEWARISSTGNVGIGTTVPRSLLSVAGGVEVGSGYTATGVSAPTNGLIVQGAVGVGTSNPTSGVALDVNGTIKISGGSPGANKVLISDANGVASWTSLSAGGVGVSSITGTTNQITASASTGAVTLSLPSTLIAPGTFQSLGNITFGDAAADTVTSNASSWTFANDTNVTLSGGLAGLSFDTNTLSIDAANDRIGVGTTTPGAKLDVAGSARYLATNTLPTGGGKGLELWYYQTGDYGLVLSYDRGTNAYQDLRVAGSSIGFEEGSTRIMTIDGGNVGIGNTAPQELLSLSSTTDPTFRIDPGNNTTVDPTIALYDTSTTAGFELIYDNSVGSTAFRNLYDNAAGDMFFQTRTGGTVFDRLMIDNSGIIGIGTTVPTDTVHVAGDILATGGFHVGADATANYLTDASSGASSATLYIGNESILTSGDIGSSVQAYDAGLTSIAGLTTLADRMIYTTASDTYAVTTLTSFARTLLDDTDAATARTTLGLVAGGAGDIWVEKAGDTMTGDLTISGGNLSLNNGTSNIVDWSANGVAAPTFTSRSAGTKVVLYPAVSASAVDYALGIQSSSMWFSIPQNAVGNVFRWYGGTTEIATLDGTGAFQIDGGLNVDGATSDIAGALNMSQNGTDVLDFSFASTNDARGISFNNRTALSADSSDGYLRLNNSSEFTNGVYTPGNLRVDGIYLADSSVPAASAPQYTFDGDTNTGMYRSGVDNIGFATGGTQRVNINSLGYVSINLPSANDPLDIYYSQPSSATNNAVQVDAENTIADTSSIINLQGIEVDVANSGGDSAGSTIYGISAVASNTQSSTAVISQTTYGVYGAAVGNANGQSTTYGVYCSASGADNNYCGGNQTWTQFSDARVKTDVSTISNALDIIESLRGVRYRRTDDGSTNLHVGFIAQEVLPYLPEVVYYDPNIDRYSMGYAEITPILVNAMQEQQIQIDKIINSSPDSPEHDEVFAVKIDQLEKNQQAQQASINEILQKLLRLDALETSVANLGTRLDQLAAKLNVIDEAMAFVKGAGDALASLVIKVPTVFNDMAFFEGPIKVNADTSETVEIPKGTLKAKITFNKSFPQKPTIYLNFIDTIPVEYKLVDINENGFSISFESPTAKTLKIQWLAILRDINGQSPSLQIIESEDGEEDEEPIVDLGEDILESDPVQEASTSQEVEEDSSGFAEPISEAPDTDAEGIVSTSSSDDSNGIAIGGVSVIEAGSTSVEVETSQLTDDSSVSVTTDSPVLLKTSRIDGTKFEISVDQPYPFDININWEIQSSE